MLSVIRPAIVTTVFFTLLLGVAYPLAVTGIGQLAFPAQAEGSLVRSGGHVVGSSLIGQNFVRPEYLHPRPSAANYDASASSGSNLGPMNPDLVERVAHGAAEIRSQTALRIPADAVTTSASGLDPDISPENSSLQVARIAKARNAPVSSINLLIQQKTTPRWLGIFGQPRVNVLAVNLALDARYPVAHVPPR
jgi:K+-transporting ATPase ATPase C chain